MNFRLVENFARSGHCLVFPSHGITLTVDKKYTPSRCPVRGYF